MASNLIGLMGYAGSGKTEFARMLQCLDFDNNISFDDYYTLSKDWENDSWAVEDCTPWEIKGFAQKLKNITTILVGYDSQRNLDDPEVKASVMPDEWTDRLSGHRPTFREFLQRLGTEVMRDNLHENVWVNALFADWRGPKMSEDYPSKWIVADVRFENEYMAIRDRGGILVRINRGKPVNGHSSETGTDHLIPDCIIDNNGSLEDFFNKAKEFYKQYMA